MNIQEEIVKWAEKYVPEFNKLSEKYNTSYYTQSPLNCIDGEVDLMLIGINPKGNLGEGSSKKTTEEYLAGNPYWSERFTKEGKTAWRYNHGARFFLGFDDFCHDESIDNDKKTVWTNLSPFESKNGNNDLRKELMEIGIKSTLELIDIIRPKRIILLGINAFEQLEKSTVSNCDWLELLKAYEPTEVMEAGKIIFFSGMMASSFSFFWKTLAGNSLAGYSIMVSPTVSE